jgi:hypothetical protein
MRVHAEWMRTCENRQCVDTYMTRQEKISSSCDLLLVPQKKTNDDCRCDQRLDELHFGVSPRNTSWIVHTRKKTVYPRSQTLLSLETEVGKQQC